jgi:hypothetical protein
MIDNERECSSLKVLLPLCSLISTFKEDKDTKVTMERKEGSTGLREK